MVLPRYKTPVNWYFSRWFRSNCIADVYIPSQFCPVMRRCSVWFAAGVLVPRSCKDGWHGDKTKSGNLNCRHSGTLSFEHVCWTLGGTFSTIWMGSWLFFIFFSGPSEWMARWGGGVWSGLGISTGEWDTRWKHHIAEVEQLWGTCHFQPCF